MAMTLEELRAHNRAAEEAEAKANVEPVVEDEVIEQPEAEVETPEAKESEETESEAWLSDSEDEQASGSGAKFSDSDVAAAKRKLRAKLERQHNEELERLRAKVEALEKGNTQPAAQSVAKVPTLEQYDYDEAKYAAAMTQWVRSQVQGAAQASEVQTRQLQQQKALEESVEAHYKRAEDLVTKFKIDPDLYRSADENFRRTVERVFPGSGDLIADQLLARLGEGSEKVAYQLGINATKRAIFEDKLRQDPNGLAVSIYLGTLLKEVTDPARKQTRAPAPAARATGGQGVVSDELSMKKKYQAEQDTQKRFDIRRKAKLAGIDVSDW